MWTDSGSNGSESCTGDPSRCECVPLVFWCSEMETGDRRESNFRDLRDTQIQMVFHRSSSDIVVFYCTFEHSDNT